MSIDGSSFPESTFRTTEAQPAILDNPPPQSGKLRAWSASAQQWIIIIVLLTLCLGKGIWFIHGITTPPDEDMVRDIGFIEATLDGNFLGDPVNAGAWRWYPPLIHWLAAGVVWLTGATSMLFWIRLGPWINLLTPLTFFVMNRRLLGAWPAVAATAVLVLFNGSAMPSDAAATYTPFSFTPSMAWPMFFGAVWLIHVRADGTRFTNALLIGAVLGLVFLAHTVPAILLSAIVTAVAVTRGGIRLRVLAWLACVAAVELALGAPFLAPLIINYRLHIVNPVPGTWVHALLQLPPIRKWLIAVNLPGVLALATLLALRRRNPLDRVSAVIFGTWIGTCALFLLRHVACGYAGQGGVCGVFVIAVHHYHAYLQAAWASLIGCALCAVMTSWNLGSRLSVRFALAAAILAGSVGFVVQPWDMLQRREALTEPAAMFDIEAYRWILANTTPRALFATPLAEPDALPTNMGPQAAAVIAAGRRLVAAPVQHANPYIDWSRPNTRRIRYLAALSDSGDATEALCAFSQEADPNGGAFFLVPRIVPVNASWVEAIFHSETSTIYRVSAASCEASSKS